MLNLLQPPFSLYPTGADYSDTCTLPPRPHLFVSVTNSLTPQTLHEKLTELKMKQNNRYQGHTDNHKDIFKKNRTSPKSKRNG